jgi:hypothetical protein
VRAEETDHGAGITPLACLVEVLTCENGGKPLADYVVWFGHGACPVPLPRDAEMRSVNHILLSHLAIPLAVHSCNDLTRIVTYRYGSDSPGLTCKNMRHRSPCERRRKLHGTT